MRRRARAVAATVGPPLAVLVAGLAAWQAAVVATGVPPVILPSPLDVAAAAGASAGTLLAAAAVTAATALLGLAAGVVVGLALALAMVASRPVGAVVQPYLVALRVAPLVAIGPLVFLWIGAGIPARALLVATLTTFPVAIGSLEGLRATPEPYLDLLRSVGASRRARLLRVRLPAAAPSVFAGVKLAAALSVIGTVVAEFLTLRAGLGYRVFEASTALATARMFAALVGLALLGLAFYGTAALIERRFPWRAPG